MKSLVPMVGNRGVSSVAYFHLLFEFQALRVATNVMKAKNGPKSLNVFVSWSVTLDKVQYCPGASIWQWLTWTPFGGKGFLNILEETCRTMFQLQVGPQTWR